MGRMVVIYTVLIKMNDYLKPAENGCHSLLQVVPPLIGIIGHLLQATAGVCAVFSGQAAVLLVDQLKLGQAFMDLPLKSLCNHKHKALEQILTVTVVNRQA